MTTHGRTFFISDLHLSPQHTEINRQFFDFLSFSAAHADALYILGDLFDVWIGDDDADPFHQDVIQALRSTTQKGLPIYFIYGNRDFLIGKKFLHQTGCQLLADEQIILLYGTPVLLMHGDTLCTQDIAYLKARKKGRNIFLQWLFLSLPLNIRKKIANRLRQKSMRHTHSTDMNIMDVTQSEVERIMQKHQVNYLIHGHTHRPNIHEFSLNEVPHERIVLGAWHERGSALCWNASGKKEIITL